MSAQPENGVGGLVADPGEILHRQVHPTFVHGGRVTSQAWMPTPKDDGLLSVSRSSVRSAIDSFHHHTRVLGLPSCGVWGVSVAECGALGLAAAADPLTKPVADHAHAVVDFRNVNEHQRKVKAKQLAVAARERGCIYAERGEK